MNIDLRLGDCLEVMRTLPDSSVSAIITDPPYALTGASRGGSPRNNDPATPFGRTRIGERGGFMGQVWDASLPSVDMWREALRVLKPGGMLLSFGGTRTYHRLACAIEDAGFEVRDCLMWVYGQGFPKSLAIDKAIDKMRHERDEVLEVTAWVRAARDARGLSNADIDAAFGFHGMAGHWTSAASQPAVPTLEQVPQLLALLGDPVVPDRVRELLLDLNGNKGQPGPDWFRRPVVGQQEVPDAHKVRPHFAGAAYSGAEAGATKVIDVTTAASDRSRPWHGYGTALKPAWEPILLAMKPLDGTFAANALQHGVAGINVDACRIGDEKRHNPPVGAHKNAMMPYAGKVGPGTDVIGRWPANLVHDGEAGLGEAARFFYCAKTNPRERGEGNDHPTVKPVALMRWLVRLVKMPAGTSILDPFMGSGSTGVACAAEGVDFVGIERDPHYLEIARKRISP